jgi:anaerobic magnesium-protoporphyrin IX monomethyl ester cyclase
MKITFVASGSEQLGITLLANIAREQGHEVSLAFSAALFKDLGIPTLIRMFDDTPYVLEKIRKGKPDVLAFSALTASYQWMLMIAREAKKILPNVKTVFGGVHVSAVPEKVVIKPEVDYVVVGEGEYAFMDILNAIASGDHYTPIQNTRFINPKGELVRGVQKGFNQELDVLPYYTKELWENDTLVENFCITMASRGCPYRCTFCFNNFFAELPDDKKNRGKYVRARSVEHVIDELRTVKSRYGHVRWVDFEDDIFTVNKPWLKEFLIRYKEEIDIPFQCLTHPRYMDDEMATWLKEAGCQWVQIGVQTMDEEFKNQNLKRYEKSSHIDKAMSAMIKAGLKVKVDHMLGLPGEPIEAQELARQLYAEHCPARIQVFWTCFLPGTELLKEGIEKGIVSKEQEERLNEGIDFFFFNNPDNIKDPLQIRIYQGYEMLFKIYPLLPKNIRKKMTEKSVRWIPDALKKWVGISADIINALRNKNPDMISYLRYYAFHCSNHLLRRMRLPTMKPSVIRPVSLRQDMDAARKHVRA